MLFPTKFLNVFAKTPSAVPSFSTQEIDLNQFLKSLEGDFRAFLGPSINLRYSLTTHLTRLDADKEQLRQLLLIFLSNAKKAMPQGGQLLLHTGEASLSDTDAFPHKQSGSYLMLTISDSGRGIPAETQKKIQNLFSGHVLTKASQLRGLAHAKTLLDNHQAKLLFFSQTIRGTSFKVYFPIKKVNSAPITPRAPRGTETLLFVEDDAMIRHIYIKFLRQRGYNVLEARDGKEAFDVYENYKGTVDLLITDVVMPELNGRQLVDLVSHRHPQLRVLYISGFTKDAIVQRGILKADMPFLEKPFGREELALRIRHLLDTALPVS